MSTVSNEWSCEVSEEEMLWAVEDVESRLVQDEEEENQHELVQQQEQQLEQQQEHQLEQQLQLQPISEEERLMFISWLEHIDAMCDDMPPPEERTVAQHNAVSNANGLLWELEQIIHDAMEHI